MEWSSSEPCRFTALLNEVVEPAMILFPEVSYADLRVSSLEFKGNNIQQLLPFWAFSRDVATGVHGSQALFGPLGGSTTALGSSPEP